jgi:hypothetical protein
MPDETAPSPGSHVGPGRIARLAGRLALAGVVIVATLLLGEGVLRLKSRWSGKPFDFREAASTLRSRTYDVRNFVAGSGTRKVVGTNGDAIQILHPYMGSEIGHDRGGVLEHFRAGLAPGEFTVLIVGGSVAMVFAEKQGSALRAALERQPRFAGRKVTVLDFAHSSHKEPQQLMRIAWFLSLGYRPDVVINIDGFNEVALAWENTAGGVHPLYPSYPAWGVLVEDYGAMDPRTLDLTLELWKLAKGAKALADFSLSWKLYHSCLWSRFALRRLEGMQAERVRLQNELSQSSARFAAGPAMRRQLGGPDFPASPDAILELCVRGWSESSRSIRALCESRGILYLHVLQPALGDKGSKPMTEEEKAIPPPSKWWMLGPELGYPKLREEGRKLAQEGEAFVDASRVFADVEENVYIDPCHLEPEGNRILERPVEKALLERVGGQ